MQSSAEAIESAFRKMTLEPHLKASILVEPDDDGPGHRVWCGQGYYLVGEVQAARIMATGDPGGVTYFPDVHPMESGYPVLRKLLFEALGFEGALEAQERILEAFLVTFPALRGVGAFQLVEDTRTVMGMETYKELKKRLQPQEVTA